MKQTERLPKLKLRLNELLGDMSVTEFAKKLGLARQTVGFYLNGDRIPDSETLIKICKTCNVSADWLLGLSEIKTAKTDLRAVCEYTGLSEAAINSLDNFSLEESKDILSKVISSYYTDSFLVLISRVSDVINEIKDLYDKGNLSQLVDYRAQIELEAELRKKLGYSVYTSLPQHTLDDTLQNIGSFAQELAKTVSGYYELVRFFDAEIQKFGYTNHSTNLVSKIATLCACENNLFEDEESDLKAINQEENEQ